MIVIACIILVVIGAINWFAVGVFDYNIVEAIFSGNAYIGAQIIYGIVGIAGLYLLFYLIYNKFSGLRINAPECQWRKKRKGQDCDHCATESEVVEVKDDKKSL